MEIKGQLHDPEVFFPEKVTLVFTKRRGPWPDRTKWKREKSLVPV
jgi:hypothetical protein